MKKIFVFLSLVLLAGLTACQKEDNVKAPETKTETFVFSSLKPGLDDEPGTKTEWTGSTIQWSANDQIRMAYSVNGTWQGSSTSTTPKLYASDPLTAATGKATFTVSSSFPSTATGTHIFYSLYPGEIAVAGTDFSHAPTANIYIPAEQTPGANTFDCAADVMVGVSEEFSAKPTDPILLTWTRQVAHAELTFKNLTINSGETIKKIRLKAFNGENPADLVGTHSINLVTGVISNPQGTTNEIVINAKNLTYSGNSIKAWVSMLPATITALTIVVETNQSYYTKTISGFSREFLKNKHNTLGIGLTGAVPSTKTYTNLTDIEEYFNRSYGSFTVNNKSLASALTYVWKHDSYGYAKGSAYKSSSCYAATSYLMSPSLTIGSDFSKVTFQHAANKLNGAAFGNYFKVVVLNPSNNNELGTLSLDVSPAGNSWDFITSTADLSSYKGQTVKIAFKYTSTNSVAGTWEIKNFKITDVVTPEHVTSETITFSTLGLKNSVQYVNPFDGGHFTITFGDGSNDGKYYNFGNAIRTYKNGTIKVGSSLFTITEISFTWSGSYAPNSDFATPTGYDVSTSKWTGESKSVILTCPSDDTTAPWRLQEVTVKYKK